MPFFLSFAEGSIALGQGETTVGRGLGCTIRFNDPTISRVHLRFWIEGESAMVEDCGTVNGTRLSGQRIKTRVPVSAGDILQVGNRVLSLRFAGDEVGEDEETTVNKGSDEWCGPGEAEERAVWERGQEEVTLDRGSDWLQDDEVPGPDQINLPALKFWTCRQCRTRAPATVTVCPDCGEPMTPARPRAVTQPILVMDTERRQSPRLTVQIPVMYGSDTLSFDGVVRDLSWGGLFIATELLDPVGTQCLITVLPDGSSAVLLGGEVCHVVSAETGEGGCPPGMGIKFRDVSEQANTWLHRALKAIGAPPASLT